MKKATAFQACNAIALITTILFFSCSSRKIATQSAHHNKAGKSQFNFLFFSDVHLDTTLAYSDYGQDAGQDLWGAFHGKIDSILNSPTPPAFVLYTGDLPRHNLDSADRSAIFKIMLDSLRTMAAVKHIPFFYLPGNNDAQDTDYCFFSNNHTNIFSLNGIYPYPYNTFNISQTPVASGAYMLNDSNIAAGYYSAKIKNGLRIISLNSVLWSNSLCYFCSENCGDQEIAGNKEMAWLKRQLAAAAGAGDQVYLAMHVPPGMDAFQTMKYGKDVPMWNKSYGWQDTFMNDLSTYRSNIAGIFYGHTHMDEFRLIYPPSRTNEMTQVAISCPGISPINGNNPGFKIVTVDSKSMYPTDFTTYYATVNKIVWQTPYRFSDYKSMYHVNGYTIYDALLQMSSAQQLSVLDTIYAVKRAVPHTYDKYGIEVR